MTTTLDFVGAVLRFVRNLLLDLRFGGFLGGSVKTAHAQLGAYDVSNSDYKALSYLFENRILPADVLVDVGCGKGRVLNWWLSRGLTNLLIGLELDERLARRVGTRLRKFPNVRIIGGDAIEHIPVNGTVFYLFNPFDAGVMVRLRDRLEGLEPRDRRLILVYYNCVHIEVFEHRPRWIVEHIALPDLRLHPAAIVSRTGIARMQTEPHP